MPGPMVVNSVPNVIGGVAQGIRSGPPPQPGVVNGPPPTAWLQNELSNLEGQQKILQEQVTQSEQNLSAQHAALMSEQQHRVEEAVKLAQDEALKTSAQTTNTDLEKFDVVLKPAIDSCTKDSITAAKKWIIDFSTTQASNQVIADFLLQK